MQNLAISTSFVQAERHFSKSQRFVPVQPSQISEVLANHGLFLNHLKTGKARQQERAHHQTTIARYVARDSADMVRVMGDGSTLDLLVRAPQLSGAIELRLGFFRGVCANQWNAGKLVESVRVSHLGDCLSELNRAIPALVERRAEISEQILAMGARKVTGSEIAMLAERVATLRLAGTENPVNVQKLDLIRPRRSTDRQSADLFTVANVLQENALRFGIRYQQHALDNRGRPTMHNMTTRKVVETTGAAIDLTGKIWEEAAALLAS